MRAMCTADRALRERAVGMPAAAPATAERRAKALLEAHGERFASRGTRAGDHEIDTDGLATSLMDLFRRTGDAQVFESLASLCAAQLLRRVRMRARYLQGHVDPHEIVQDVLINIYRYPDRFDASRPGAFRAWSSMIVDNAVRRSVRRHHTGPRLQPVDLLALAPDPLSPEPMQEAIDHEALEADLRTYCVFLGLYLNAYQTLSARERHVLQMVEVHGMRYAQLASTLRIRAETLKMVVFRARRRIAERMGTLARGASQR
jgi:RNA polymerase sigma-70 factor, ECF subfamily